MGDGGPGVFTGLVTSTEGGGVFEEYEARGTCLFPISNEFLC